MIKNIFLKYNLPPLQRAEQDSEAARLIANAKVLRYAKDLPVQFAEICTPAAFLEALRNSAGNQTADAKYRRYTFDGTTAGELQIFLDTLPQNEYCQVLLASERILCDTSLRLRSKLKLIGSDTEFYSPNEPNPFLAESVSCTELRNIQVRGGGRNATIMLLNCDNVTFYNLSVSHSEGYGIVLRGQSHHVTIAHCTFDCNKRSGIMIHDGSSFCHVHHCTVTAGHHSSNWAAGIVITALEPASPHGVQDAFEESFFYPKNLDLAIPAVPHHNLVEHCSVHHNQSSGIYLDGGNGNILFSNHITNNDKEGLCLDFYAAVNLVLENTITDNGFRRKQSNHDLEIDMVLSHGRLADNSSPAKLPNISIDNAGLNILCKNTIANAAGDGIKIVRAGFRNLIYNNVIADNNQGQNSIFSFAGILLGSAGSEMANDTSGLDRLASYENMIFANMIYGQHKFGILSDIRSQYNDIFDNFIKNQLADAAIQLTRPNNFVGNNFNVTITSKTGYLLLGAKRALKVLISRDTNLSAKGKYLGHCWRRTLELFKSKS